METTQTNPTSVFDIYIKKNADNIHLLKLKASFGATAFLFHSLMSLSGVTPLPKHTRKISHWPDFHRDSYFFHLANTVVKTIVVCFCIYTLSETLT